ALAVPPGFSGHAVSVPRLVARSVAADGFHVIGASGWLGTLFLVVFAGLPAARMRDKDQRAAHVARLVTAFSPVALSFAALAAATGVFASWLHLPSVSALWQTPYGQALLRKLVILSGAAATGFYNW